jgi:hypothetical protein
MLDLPTATLSIDFSGFIETKQQSFGQIWSRHHIATSLEWWELDWGTCPKITFFQVDEWIPPRILNISRKPWVSRGIWDHLGCSILGAWYNLQPKKHEKTEKSTELAVFQCLPSHTFFYLTSRSHCVAATAAVATARRNVGCNTVEERCVPRAKGRWVEDDHSRRYGEVKRWWPGGLEYTLW